MKKRGSFECLIEMCIVCLTAAIAEPLLHIMAKLPEYLAWPLAIGIGFIVLACLALILRLRERSNRDK